MYRKLSPCSLSALRLNHLFLGSQALCGSLDTGGYFKLAECPKSPLPVKPPQLLLNPLSSVCPGGGQNPEDQD